IFFTKSNSERYAYLSSSREGGKGGFDLYAISYVIAKEMADGFPSPLSMLSNKLLAGINIQNESLIDTTKVTLLKGIVMGDDSVYLKAKVALSDNKLGQVIATQEAEENGAYRIMIPGGSNYGIAVSYPGYLFHSENFELPEQTEYKEIEKDIVLKKIAIGKNVALKNLFFETNKADLSDESIVELSNVIKLLTDNPTLHIEIQGHTDNRGSKAYNQGLSERRAKSVVDYLIQHGIAPERLTSKGYGLTKPVASNKTEAGRAENRRTELLVTKI
ncbi:MAG: OmpA family protein, partial [Paludibacteraceae bacterium]|nr:OmpA family protein [Paludibacteraceae bacterium]